MTLRGGAVAALGVLLARAPLPAKTHVVRLAGGVAARVAERITAAPFPGVRLDVCLDDRIQRLMWAGAYERETVSLIRDLIEPGGVFLDIGAHIGYFSAIAAGRAGPSGRVHAFEPDPDNLASLRLLAQRRPTIEVWAGAVSDTDGRGRLFRTPLIQESGWGTILPVAREGREAVDVELLTLDAWAAVVKPERIDLLKIDTEGAECRVLAGAQTLVRRYFPAILVEANVECLRRDRRSENDLIDMLVDAGYKVSRVHTPRGRLSDMLLAVPEQQTDSAVMHPLRSGSISPPKGRAAVRRA